MLLVIVALGSVGLYLLRMGPALFIKPPKDDRIAFISDRLGNTDIWTMMPDGTEPTQITDDFADERCLEWSPNVTEMAYVTNKTNRSYQISVIGWTGGYHDDITYSYGVKDVPRWSADGKNIIYISNSNICMKKRHGGEEEQVLPPKEFSMMGIMSQLNKTYRYADYSRDGKILLFTEDSDLGMSACIMPLQIGKSIGVEEFQAQGGNYNQVVIGKGRYLEVVWDKQGKKVAVAYIGNDNKHGLSIYDTESGKSRVVFETNGDTTGVTAPVWSPDGSSVAYEKWKVRDSNPDRAIGIFSVNAASGKETKLHLGDAHELTWSPEGDRLAFSVYREDGKRDVWRVNSDGSDPVDLTKGAGDNYNPKWSPDVEKK